MDYLNTISTLFPGFSARQLEQFAAMGPLYAQWNGKINVVSRKDIDNIYPNHIIHSLALAAFFGPLEDGTALMDLGTGGGFPGIPLAVAYPGCRFHMVDRIAKKLTVASEIARELGLQNVSFQHGDAGECHTRFDYVVSRAVMALDPLVKIAARNVVRQPEHHNRYAPGLVCLKGGDLDAEVKAAGRNVVRFPIGEFLPGIPYDQKEIIYVPM